MIFCDMRSVRKLISSLSKEREAAFWNVPSSWEQCFSSCGESSGRQHLIAMRLIWVLQFLKVSSIQQQVYTFFFNMFSGLQFRYIRVQCNLTPRLDCMGLNHSFWFLQEISVKCHLNEWIAFSQIKCAGMGSVRIWKYITYLKSQNSFSSSLILWRCWFK